MRIERDVINRAPLAGWIDKLKALINNNFSNK